MIRRMKQWAAIVMMAFTMAVVMPAQMLTAFAAGAKITFSDPSAKVGSQIKVNMKVTNSSNLANVDIVLAYDASALEFVSGTNAEGGAGAVRVHGDGGTPGAGSMTFTLQFKALASGSSKISVTSQEIYDSNSKLVTVDHQGDATVTVGALETASKDATLKSLKVSPGSLSPAFSPDVDTYAVTVGTDVDKLVISADTTDENAANVISGNEGLQMGENRVTCKVTAQDGETTKEYVITVTKAEGGDSTPASADADQQVKMEITRRTITILPPDDSVKVPDGFKATTINIDGHKVQGWVWGADKDPQYCVVYGMNEAGEKNLYRYDMKDSERTLQRYFEDPVQSDMVTPEQYNTLAGQYDKLREDFNLYRILLAATVAIAVVLLIILLVVVLNKKDKGQKPDGSDPSGSRGSRGKSSARQKKQLESRDGEDCKDRGTQEYQGDDPEDYDQEYGDEYDEPDDRGQASEARYGYRTADEDVDADGYTDADDYLDEDLGADGYLDEDGYEDADSYRAADGHREAAGYRAADDSREAAGYRAADDSREISGYREADGYRNTDRNRDPGRSPAGAGLREAAGGRRSQPEPPIRESQPLRPVRQHGPVQPSKSFPSSDAVQDQDDDDDFEVFDL